ncbi:unnamed protein product [Timema podura]|uniref:DUF4201 domain-containing protein n=1 Tax=Timema podura TaxID=61482 RepID=A0ABN7NZ40_TIMPD|nr:unnamed protein product [Timema podura]
MEETIELYDLPYIAQNKSASYVRLATMVTEAKQKLKVCKSVFAKATPTALYRSIAKGAGTSEMRLSARRGHATSVETCVRIQVSVSAGDVAESLDTSKAEVDEKMYINSQLERKLCNLDDTLPLQEKQIQNISQIYEEKCVDMNKIQWQQTKAEIVAAKEEEYEEKYFQTTKKLKVMETTFTDGDIQIQNEIRKKKVLKLKNILQEKKMSKLDDLKAKKDEMANNLSQEVARVERENSVLKKRNIAFLLRTQKQLKEEEFAYQHLALRWNSMSTM